MSKDLSFLFILVFSTVPAWGAPRPFLTDLKDCSVLLAGLESDSVEEHFLKAADSQEKMVSLLVDYGFIFSQRFNDALQWVLAKQGLPIYDISSNKLKSLNRRQEKTVVTTLHGLKANYDLSKAAMSDLVWQAVDRIVSYFNLAEASAQEKIEHLRFTQLVSAAKKSPQRVQFEATMGQHIRESLVATSQNLLEALKNTLQSSDRRWSLRACSLGAVGALAGGAIAAAGILCDVDLNMVSDWNQFVFGFGLGVGGVGYVGGNLGLRKGRQWQASRIDWSLAQLEIGEASAVNEEDSQRLLPPSPLELGHAGSLFQTLHTSASAQILTLAEACQKDVCTLTPVEIAYLGHVDILELKNVFAEFKTLHQKVKAAVIDTRANARRLLANLNSKTTHMMLSQSLARFIAQLEELVKTDGTSLSTFQDRADQLESRLNQLRARPYEQSAELSDEQVEKYASLMTKIESDLSLLDGIKKEVLRSQQTRYKIIETLASFRQIHDRLLDPAIPWEGTLQEIMRLLEQAETLIK